jgi:hypothetical protein
MNQLIIPERNIKLNYPSSWEEIGYKDAGRIGEIMYKANKGEIDYDMARKLAVDVLLNRVNGSDKPMYGPESLNYWWNESLLANSVNFLFEKKKGNKGVENMSINPKFCIQIIPRVRVGFHWYQGPKDLLSDITILEWKETSWRVGKYSKTHDDNCLDEIFAVLYIRKKDMGEKELTIARRVPIGIKFMVYLFFLGCMNWIREETIEIDGEDINFGCLFPTGKEAAENSKGDEDNTGLAGILFQMAESGVFGNMEQTSKVNMWDVFLRLYQIHQQIKRMK